MQDTGHELDSFCTADRPLDRSDWAAADEKSRHKTRHKQFETRKVVFLETPNHREVTTSGGANQGPGRRQTKLRV